jgi:5-methylcytosine-specific restriction endonuclease McrA
LLFGGHTGGHKLKPQTVAVCVGSLKSDREVGGVMADSEVHRGVVTWNDLPRWVQKQRNWYRKHRDELGGPEPEPEWGEDELSQSLKKLYQLAAEKAAELGPQPPAWYEFDGDRAAEEILVAWIEHLRCPECDMTEPGDFGDEWGTVVCSNMDCEHEWQPDWFTPWGSPTPKAKKPRSYTVGECPMCGKQNRRMDPRNPYDFVCHLPRNNADLPALDFFSLLFMDPDEFARSEQRMLEAATEIEAAYQSSCHNRYWLGHAEGWFRFLPVYFPYCKGCGALFAARLEDQEFCCRQCGKMPKDYSRKLRLMASRVSPTLRRREVFERDQWLCHICDEPIDPEADYSLDRASLDHVIPIAAGGTHTMDNVRASHLRCNIQKSDTVLDDDELLFLRSLLRRDQMSGKSTAESTD